MIRALALALCCGSSLACGPTSPGGSRGEASTSPADAVAQSSTLTTKVGSVLELAVPLWGGGRIEVAELRGRPVLLTLEDASVPQREAAHDRFRALVEQDEEIVVVVVSLDASEDDLPAGWHDAPPFVLGWDPQGALAARLRLVALPTVVLLDHDGCVVSVHEGALPSGPSLDAWLGAGNGTKAACVAAAP